MLTSILLSLTLAAEPRGFDVRDPVKLIVELEQRLPDWLLSKGDRNVHLATSEELKAYAGGRDELVPELLAEQSAPPGVTTFAGAVRAFVEKGDAHVLVSFFDARGQRCAVLLLGSGDRYVVGSGPRVDRKTFEEVALDRKMIFEKKQNAWTRHSTSSSLPCSESLKRAARAVFLAEKSFFAENDRYTASMGELGEIDLPAGATVKVTLTGNKSAPHFRASLSMNGGEVTLSDSEGSPTLVRPCSK